MNELSQLIIAGYVIFMIVCILSKKYKLLLYILEWLIPTSTAVYIYLHDYKGVDMIAAYLVACTVGAIIYYPLNRYVFKR